MGLSYVSFPVRFSLQSLVGRRSETMELRKVITAFAFLFHATLSREIDNNAVDVDSLRAAVMGRVHREFRVNFNDDEGEDGEMKIRPCNYYQKYHKKITDT